MGFLTSDRARRDGRVTVVQFLTSLVGFVAFSVMGGVLLAGLALPAVTIAGQAANGTAEIFESLPEEFSNTSLPQSSYIYASDGSTLLATFYTQNRVVVPLEEISPWMQKAVIAIEDKRFWEHNGVDGEGLLRVAYLQLTSDGTQGASTLTQQLVKNTLLEAAELKDTEEEKMEARKAANEVSVERKIREWRLALAYEERLNQLYGNKCTDDPKVDCGKEQVLEQYLNIAQFGPSVYGVEAASRFYFGIPASELNALQAATIAGITQNPSKWDPVRYPENNIIRRDNVLGVMKDQGMITTAEYIEYKNTPLEDYLHLTYPKFSCAASDIAPFFCDYITKLVAKHPIFEGQGTRLLYRGGLRIVTTLDLNMQIAANEELQASIPMGDESGLANALVALDNATGNILAMSQNRVFDPASKAPNSTAINYAVDREYGGSRGFSPGSTFKPVILAQWLASGRSLNQVVSGTARDWDLSSFKASCPEGGGYVGKWKPTNADGGSANQSSVLAATASSINTAYVSMIQQLDLCQVRDMAQALGFQRADGNTFEVVPSISLGSQNASPMTMASVYQTFANRGVHCTPRAIIDITDLNGNPAKDSDGNLVKWPETECQQVISSDLADGVTFALTKVIEYGSASRIKIGRPAAGKTGTSQGNAHTWFAGYTPQVTAVVWTGNPDRDVPQRNIRVNGTYYRSIFGSTLSAPTWGRFMVRAMAPYDVVGLPTAPASMLDGMQGTVPDLLCLSETDAQLAINDAGFSYSNGGSFFSLACPLGTVVTQNPAAGTTMGTGVGVTYYLASDQKPDWWYNWPPTWNPANPPSDWWGGNANWPPAEFTTNPPNGWPSGGGGGGA